MKITVAELKQMIREALEEAKKNEQVMASSEPKGMMPNTNTESYAKTFDFCEPLGDNNRLKQQGQANWGPYTEEKALRMLVRQMISEAVGPVVGHQPPLCQHIFKSNKKSGNIWETAMNLTESVCEKCGAKMAEAHLGFKKLKNKLAHKKGVTNPAALAASIGRKKYGSAEMAKKAAAGKKKG